MDHVEEPGTGDATLPHAQPAAPSPAPASPVPDPTQPVAVSEPSPAPAPAPLPAPLPPPAPPAASPPPPPPPLTPGYGQAQYGAYPPPYPQGYPPPGAPTRRSQQLELSKGRRRLIAGLAILGLLAVPAVVGYDLGQRDGSTSDTASSITVPNGGVAASGSNGSTGSNGSSTGAANGTLDATAIAAKVDDSVVNLTTTLSSGGKAAGTGIIISSNGLVLTNNHVIANSTSIEAENSASGATWSAKVLGYDPEDDIALVQLEDASGLKSATLGSASSLNEGDPIVALGNAGGHGGSPTVVTGYVTALDQQITAADQDGSNPETLQGLVQINADIQPGDSGGPLVNSQGAIVGMNAAASSGNGFGFGQSANEGYAIPIENATAIAKKIASGQGGQRIHVGANRALLGVAVAASTAQGGLGQSSDGAVVNSVQSGSAAESAGIQAGDVITGVDDINVTSAQELTHALVPYQPKDTVKITWTDSSGQSHHADVQLGSGPPS